MIYTIEESTAKSLADQVRRLTGTTDEMSTDEMAVKLESVTIGGESGNSGNNSGSIVEEKDVIFIDYDGTILYSYTVEEAQALDELPPLPSHAGLICQGWNYDLETVKAYNREIVVGATYTTDDGTTRIYIALSEGRTSPAVGLAVNGTVTVDWGDGTTPDTLTGTSTDTIVYTSNHEYKSAGEYVIKLTVDGKACIYGFSNYHSTLLVYSGSDDRDEAYLSRVKHVEIGHNVSIGQYAFANSYGLEWITIPEGTTSIGNESFGHCFYHAQSLKSITIPRGFCIWREMFSQCNTMEFISIPDETDIGGSAFGGCYALRRITIPYGVSVGETALTSCSIIKKIEMVGISIIPKSLIGYAYKLNEVKIVGNEKINIETNAITYCPSLTVVKLSDIKNIYSRAFRGNRGVKLYDFSLCTSVPSIARDSFDEIPSDCEIRVPAALYDEWIAATNWSTYASQIVGV